MTTTTWTNGAADGLWETPGNWDNGVPDATLDVVIAGSDAITLTTHVNTKGLDCSGFTGSLLGSSYALHTRGDTTLSAGMTFGLVGISMHGDNTPGGVLGTLTTAGHTLDTFNARDGIIATLADDVTCGDFEVYDTDTELHMGAHVVTIIRGPINGYGYIYTDPGQVITYSAGAKFVLTPAAGEPDDGDAPTIDTSGATMPPIEVRGTGTTYFNMLSDLVCESFLIDTANMATSNVMYTMTITGDLTITDATLNGIRNTSVWTVGGDFNCNSDLLGVVAWTLDVTGTNELHDSTISNCNCIGTELDASDGCTDGGGNTNVNFGAPAAINAQPFVDAGIDQSILFGTTLTLTGGATDDGLPLVPGALTYAWTKVSGPGTFTPLDASDPTTTATLSKVGTYVLRLTADDGELTSTDDLTVQVEANMSDSAFGSPGDPIDATAITGTESSIEFAYIAPRKPDRKIALWGDVAWKISIEGGAGVYVPVPAYTAYIVSLPAADKVYYVKTATGSGTLYSIIAE